MRKHVKPAHPRATIPDPVRRRDLPPEGYAVEWSVHWIRLEARGDVIVTELNANGELQGGPSAAPAQASTGEAQDDPAAVHEAVEPPRDADEAPSHTDA